MKSALLAVVVVAALVVGYHQVMTRVGSGTPPAMAPAAQQADAITVDKAARRLMLLRSGEEIAVYDISLGGAPVGHKSRQGDEKTPEGTYLIDWRNGNSIAHLSLHISYPDAADVKAAAGADPGGMIMIHGLPNGWGWLGRLHLLWDRTDGCIAVTNAEMREIWAVVPNCTPITILPG